jgi:hypothetical protein
MRFWGLFLAVVAFGLASPGADAPGLARAGAQEPSRRPRAAGSHDLLPGGLDRRTAEQLLAERLHIPDPNSLAGLLETILKNPDQYGLNKEEIKKFAQDAARRPEQLGINFNDPEWRKLAERFQKEHGAQMPQLDPELQKKFEALKQTIKTGKPPDMRPPDGNPPDIKPPDIKPPDGNPPDVKPPMPPQVGGNPPQSRPLPPVTKPQPPMTAPGTQARSASEGARQDNSFVSKFIDRLRASDGLTGNLRDRLSGLFGDDTRLGRMFRGLSGETSRLGRNLMPRLSDRQVEGLMRNLGKFVPRDLRVNRPRLNVNVSPSAVRGAASSALGGAVLVLVLLVVGLVAFLLIGLKRGWIGSKEAVKWRLGPWPVSPSDVHTREDLVKAFEYLALLRLGQPAETANHLDIAKRLASGGCQPPGVPESEPPNKREAARELALLYEQARYAPPDEQLSADELDTARRDLTYLAGARAA